MSKLLPTNPSEVTVIRQVVPNAITTFSAPFWRFGRIQIGGRGTVVRMRTGGLAVFSPTALTPEVKETVTALGEVKYITALDMEHHLYLGPWHKEYPNATVLGPEGLMEKRKKQNNEDVPIHVVFDSKNKDSNRVNPEFDEEFEYAFVDTHPNKELVFHHKPTRTLIEADLLFNLPAKEQVSKVNLPNPQSGILNKIFQYFTNTRGQAIGQRRFVWYLTSRMDRPAFNKSVAQIRTWNFDRIIPCHGDVIETGGKAVFENVMAWHIQDGKKAT